MVSQIYNFGAGPSMIPSAVMMKIHQEFLDYKGFGASIVELSHRLPFFKDILDKSESIFRELTGLPDNYRLIFMHGGAQMQFSAVPLNLMARKSHIGSYLITGRWGILAEKEARRYGKTEVPVDGKEFEYRRIPDYDFRMLNQNSSYVHLTSNNTLYGTCWQKFPETRNIPLVVDATSDILSREIDYSLYGVVYAGLQKNLGIPGTSIVVVREDLIGNALPQTPKLLDYSLIVESQSILNTINVFAVYVALLILEWIKEQGGVSEMEKLAEQKSGLLYKILDESDFYIPVAHPDHRSKMNVTFHFGKEILIQKFLLESEKEGLFALKGHASVGGVRASIYNAMPLDGVKKLADFMKEFERVNG